MPNNTVTFLASFAYASQRVRAAIKNTQELEPDHWLNTCASRAGAHPLRAGSFFPRLTAENLEELITQMEWEPYSHSAVKEPATAFMAVHCPGVMGVTRLADIPDEEPLGALRFDDTKDTGQVSLVWHTDLPGVKVDFTVLLVGPRSPEDSTPIVWSFFPGDPVSPSDVPRHAGGVDRHGLVVDKREACALGVEWVKLAPKRG